MYRQIKPNFAQTKKPNLFQSEGYSTSRSTAEAIARQTEQSNKEAQEAQAKSDEQSGQTGSMMGTAAKSLFSSSSAAPTQAYGEGLGMFPVTEATPAVSSATGTGSAAGGSAAGGGSSAAGGSGAAEGGGAALGWWAALAAALAKGADYNQDKGYHTWSDIEQGTWGTEKIKNIGWADQMDDIAPGLGEMTVGSSNLISPNPKMQAKGVEDVAKGTGEFSRGIGRQVRGFSEDNQIGQVLSGAWLNNLFS